MFQSIILAGGFGTRLKSVSGNIPKPMVLVGGEPFLYILMRRLERQGCTKIILSLHYMAGYVIDRVNTDSPVSCPVEYSVEKNPLGTGGAIKQASMLVSDERFIVLNGDTYCDVDYLSLLSFADQAQLIVTSVKLDNVSRYGKLEINNSFDVIGMEEKGTEGKGHINAGTYVIKKVDILAFPKREFSLETHFIPFFRGSFKAFIIDGDFVDIGVPRDYQYACDFFS